MNFCPGWPLEGTPAWGWVRCLSRVQSSSRATQSRKKPSGLSVEGPADYCSCFSSNEVHVSAFPPLSLPPPALTEAVWTMFICQTVKMLLTRQPSDRINTRHHSSPYLRCPGMYRQPLDKRLTSICSKGLTRRESRGTGWEHLPPTPSLLNWMGSG